MLLVIYKHRICTRRKHLYYSHQWIFYNIHGKKIFSVLTCTLLLSGESVNHFFFNEFMIASEGHPIFKTLKSLALWLNINLCVCMRVGGGGGGGSYLLYVFMYIEKKFHKFTETALPLPLTSDERDCYLLKVESRIFKNAFNCLYSHWCS